MGSNFDKFNLEYDNEIPYSKKICYEIDLLDYEEKYINEAYFSLISNSFTKTKARLSKLYQSHDL